MRFLPFVDKVKVKTIHMGGQQCNKPYKPKASICITAFLLKNFFGKNKQTLTARELQTMRYLSVSLGEKDLQTCLDKVLQRRCLWWLNVWASYKKSLRAVCTFVRHRCTKKRLFLVALADKNTKWQRQKREFNVVISGHTVLHSCNFSWCSDPLPSTCHVNIFVLAVKIARWFVGPCQILPSKVPPIFCCALFPNQESIDVSVNNLFCWTWQ